MGKLRQTLDSLPETLDETYDRILCQIDPLSKREVLSILQWLTFSLRPLSLNEVAEIVAFDVDSVDKFNSENRLADPEDVLNMCSSLVISIETNNDHEDSNDDLSDFLANNTSATSTSRARRFVRLAHFSVKEYLVSDRIRTGSAAFFTIDEEASNARIGATGLSCLQLYNEALFPGAKEFSTEFPIARYSAKFWYKHLSAIGGTAHLSSIAPATELFLSERKMRNWIDLYNLDQSFESLGSPLYYAVLTGLKVLVEALIEVQKDKDCQVGETDDSKLKRPDSDDGSATLQDMSKEAYVNVTGGFLHTPLQAASWSGRMDIVELLINNAADPNLYGGLWSGSALWAAAHKGHLDVMKFLLDTGADLYEGFFSETSGGSKEGMLGRIDARNLPGQEIDRHTEHFKNENMRTLAELERVNKNVIRPSIDTHDRSAIEQRRETALYGAACSGNAEAARFLLDRDERGVIINLRNGANGDTALLRAAKSWHEAFVQILLQRGALIDKTNFCGKTALMEVCRTGNESIARKLLDKGADPNCHSLAENHAASPLRAAIVKGHEPIVRLLIDHGANLDMHFPLIEAVRRGHKDIAKLLVEKGADVNAVQYFDRKDGVPFWLYALPTTSCLADVKCKLLSISRVCLCPNGRNPSKRQGSVWEDSPLWVAAALGDVESVKLLLDNGANPKARGACAFTPLDMAIFEEHAAVIQLLLAAVKDSKPEIETIGASERGDSLEKKVSTSSLHSDIDDISKASQQDFEPSEAHDNGGFEYLQPQNTQPLENSTNLKTTTQQQPQSSLQSSQHFPGRNVIVFQSEDGSEHTIDPVKMLLEAKNHAKTNGFKRFGRMRRRWELYMHNSSTIDVTILHDLETMSRAVQGDFRDYFMI